MNGSQRTTFRWSIVDMSMLKWVDSHPAHYSPLWKQILSLPSHSKTSTRRSVAPQKLSQLWPFYLLRFRFIPLHLLLSQKMLTNMSHHFCNMLHRSTACHTICRVSLRRVNIYLLGLHRSANAYFCKNCAHARTHSEEAVESGVGAAKPPAGSCWRWTLTSPRGPGFPTRPVLRWCRVCRHTPGCCVCSEPRSSGTPDSSCPAGTCSTKHQPPSRRTLCRLRYIKIRVAEMGRFQNILSISNRKIESYTETVLSKGSDSYQSSI